MECVERIARLIANVTVERANQAQARAGRKGQAAGALSLNNLSVARAWSSLVQITSEKPRCAPTMTDRRHL